ncbi:MAG TPA: GNAT family N-acetyltransferase [Mycobacterium sp.]|nr:GNAT family N-acetyltransferase [Mycobacterium sp.]HTX93965.1 GNAT family N-acetyltransferase [Mycobacterium sp.]
MTQHQHRVAVPVKVRAAHTADVPECGRVCYAAFGSIATNHGFPPDFPSVEAATAVVSGLIEHPGFFSLVAEYDGRVVGSSFLDERSAIVGVGHVSVALDMQNRRVGRALLDAMLQRCAERRVPGVRLLQAAYKNRSMCLYAKLGFDVREPFAVVQGDPLALRIAGYPVRAATAADIETCNALCLRVHGHDRGGELSEALTLGTARVVERGGRITGYTTGIGFYAHSVAETDDDLQALIGAAEEFSGLGFLVPMRNTGLLRWCLAHGLRVVFGLNLMTIGLYSEPRGAFLASVWY